MYFKTGIAHITQTMCDSITEPIERATICDDMNEIAFLEVFGGSIAIHHISLGQTLSRRFTSISTARQHLISKGIVTGVSTK